MLTRDTLTRVAQYAGVALLLAVVVPSVVFAVPQVAGADNSYVVLSSSMSPTIHAGDAVVVDGVPPDDIDERDIITFHATGATADTGLVTHRVIDVVERDDGRYFRTQGDANEEPDSELVPAENVVGVVRFHIPYFGYLVQFVNTSNGLLAFVVVPSVLLVLNELWNFRTALTDDEDSDTPTEND
ncbi:signal peptidase I [Salarchaeum sp. III]|uniref:signal peptidase I n=1 Tax=Salarchaeum sp. III TaxID=3107927 RepID=UPI002ED8E51A